MLVTITSQETLLEEVKLISQIDSLAIQIKNTGLVALNSFKVKFKATESNDFITLYELASDWTSPPAESFIRLGVSSGSATDPTTLAPGEEYLFYMDGCAGMHSLLLISSVAFGETTLEINIGGGK